MGDGLESAAAAKQEPAAAADSTSVAAAAATPAATTGDATSKVAPAAAAASKPSKAIKASSLSSNHKRNTNVINKRLKALFTHTKEAATAVMSSDSTNNTQVKKNDSQSNSGSTGTQERGMQRGGRGYSGYYSPWGVYRPYSSVSMAGWGGASVCAQAERAMACSFGRKLRKLFL